MASKRNKKKLSSKQANRISLLISTIGFIFMLVIGLISKPTGKVEICYWIMGCIVAPMFIYLIFYFFIFKGEGRKAEEDAKEIEIVTTQHLSCTDFTQVYFLVKGYGSHIDMMRQILQKEGCKFYAKLTENKNIYLIVKDKYNEEVYSVEIQNHVYFHYNFKFEE